MVAKTGALMNTETSPPTADSKLDQLRLLADNTGRLMVIAVDHRANLRAALSSAAGRDVGAGELIEFKRAVVRTLSTGCSAALLDPEYGLPAAQLRASNCGLLLAYEKSGYDNARPGRRPDLLTNQSVFRLREAGAQAIKLLLHYSNLEDSSVNEEKMAFVERVGAECHAHLLPFFLEIITYDSTGSLSPIELARRRPALIGAAVSEFSRPRYFVDVLKLELPVAANLLKGAFGESSEGLSRAEALRQIRQALASARQPVVFLSGGVSVSDFIAGIELAAESGISFHGALCGRAIWNGGIGAYAQAGARNGAEARLERWLSEEGAANLAAVRTCLARRATPLPSGVA
ncbi:MAG: tagatose 1,6-diphosphate aldolase [Candidatus Acidiferrales bacterium]